MALVLVASPGAANANSYLTLAEALSYYEGRAPLPGWEDADDQSALLVMATRLLDSLLSPTRQFVPASGSTPAYYRIRSTWTGAATVPAVQVLAWPRIGMFNRNGYPIADTAIPQDLKNAVAELAGALGTKDTTLDNDNAVQGITGVRAGSVSVNFSTAGVMTTKMLPDVVLAYLVPSWTTDEVIEGTRSPEFVVL
jgi:hypothetical protein